MNKQQKSISLTPQTIQKVKDMAKDNLRDFSSMVEVMLIDQMKLIESKQETVAGNPK